jgi:hypothetical protein
MDFDIPLVIRGQVIDDFSARFSARRGEIGFRTADAAQYLDRIVLRNPIGMQDLYRIPMSDILDFLDELSRRLAPSQNAHIRLAMDINQRTSGLATPMVHHIYETMRHALSRDSVAEAVERNIGLACLEGWETRQLRDRVVKVRAFGARVVHLNAGNAPAVALHGIINGSVLRCDNIVKSPSNDPYSATAIALTMIDMDRDHPLTKHLTVAYWKGGDAAFEKRLYKPTHIEKIIAWGGFASMGHIRGYLGPGMDLVALDPKISASILGREVFEDEATMRLAARRLARDVGTMNQEGCVNTRMVYAESGTDPESLDRLNRFGRMTYDEIQALPENLSSPHPAFDSELRHELDGLRFSDLFQIIGAKANEGGVIVSQESEAVDFSHRLACRTINIVPYPTAQDAARQVTVDTQTISVYPTSLIDRIRDQCAWQGAQRITPLGCSTYIGIANPHDAIEPMRRIARWVMVEDYDDATIERGVGFVHGGATALSPDAPAELLTEEYAV